MQALKVEVKAPVILKVPSDNASKEALLELQPVKLILPSEKVMVMEFNPWKVKVYCPLMLT